MDTGPFETKAAGFPVNSISRATAQLLCNVRAPAVLRPQPAQLGDAFWGPRRSGERGRRLCGGPGAFERLAVAGNQ